MSGLPHLLLNSFRWMLAALLCLSGVLVIVWTYRWPLVWDAQVLHYINFLIGKGFAPYRDITDMNMPGAYMIEGLAMQVFGGTDLAWRIYDFTLLALLSVAMIAVAQPYDWVAGLFAGVMFTLVHAQEGPKNSAQRDEVMTVLLMLGYAFLFAATRRKRPWMMLAFGLSLGMAGAVKPTVAPLGVVLLAMALWDLKKKGDAIAPYLVSGLTGAAIAGAAVLSYLVHFHSVHEFISITRRLTPYYAGLDHAPLLHMLRYSLPRVGLLLIPFAVVVAVVDKEWKSWERWAILVGVAFGVFSYFAQAKGYPYHRYPLNAFGLLWIALELMLAMQKTGWVRIVGIAGMAAGTLWVLPTYLQRVQALRPPNDYTPALEADLMQMGGNRLDRRVQCLDLVDGCLNALYHLKLVQTTGWTGDLLLFAPRKSPVVDYYRDEFWDELTRNPPSVIVLSNEWFNYSPTFGKLNQWPKMANYLKENYTLVVSRQFAAEYDQAYRIYVRNGVSLPLPKNAS